MMTTVTYIVICMLLPFSACSNVNLEIHEYNNKIEVGANLYSTLINMTREEKIRYETDRIYAFFGTTMESLFDREPNFPNFFGGRYWLRYNKNPIYLIVFIVEDYQDDAAEFLAYIKNFETVIVDYTNIKYNYFIMLFNQVWNSAAFRSPFPFHSTWTNIRSGEMVVTLKNYSDEGIEFFRTHISDSPLIRLRCVYDGIW